MLRRTLAWLAVFLTVGGAAAGYALWEFGRKADGYLLATVRAEFARVVPHGAVAVAGAAFDWDRRVTLTDVRVTGGDADDAAVAVLPEVRLTLDRTRFRESERLELRAVRLERPTFTLRRRADGTWAVADLLPLALPDPPPPAPDWTVRDATVRFELETGGGLPPFVVTLSGIDLDAVPVARRRYELRGTAAVDRAGELAFSGWADLDRGTWSLAGSVDGLTLSGGLLADAFLGSSEMQAKLATLRSKFEATQDRLAGGPGANRPPLMTASADLGGPGSSRRGDSGGLGVDRRVARPSDFGLDGDLDLTFSAGVPSPGAAFDSDVTVSCRAGRLVNRFLPFELSDVTGTLRVAGGELVLENARGTAGLSRMSAEGRFRPAADGLRGVVRLSGVNLPVDARSGPRLPEALRKLHDVLNPTGLVDLSVAEFTTLAPPVAGRPAKWTLTDLDVAVRDGTARPAVFPYPVRAVVGTATMNDAGVIDLAFTGEANGRTGTFTGWAANPGPAVEYRGVVRADGLPIDPVFRAACPPPVAAALDALVFHAFPGGAGVGDVRLDLHRPPGARTEWSVTAAVRDARVNLTAFPYPVAGLSGTVRYDSNERVWRFADLAGRHGDAALVGAAQLELDPRPGRLAVWVEGENAPLDAELRAALPGTLRDLWDQLRPGGRATFRSEVTWTPGSPAVIALPRFAVRGGSAAPACFPLPLGAVELDGSYRPRFAPGVGRLDVTRFTASHLERVAGAGASSGGAADGTRRVTTTGAASVEHRDDGRWTLRFEDLATPGLPFGPNLRAACPPSMRAGLESLDPRGTADVTADVLEFRGIAGTDAEVTSAWRVNAVLPRNRLSVGFDAELADGRVLLSGTCDGTNCRMDGRLTAPRVSALDHTLEDVDVPFALRGGLLTVGRGDPASAEVLARPRDDRATATAYGGAVALDAVADLNAGPDYRARIDLNGLNLGRYAARELGVTGDVAGVVRGAVNLRGSGPGTDRMTGEGVVKVRPAALYELPMMLRMFSVANYDDPTAFTSADARFNIGRNTVSFSEINLTGKSISFRGKGYVGLNRRLDLMFYSRPAGRTVVPVFSNLWSGWIGVRVRGSLDDYRVTKSVPRLDDSLRLFLEPLRTGRAAKIPEYGPPLFPGFGNRPKTARR